MVSAACWGLREKGATPAQRRSPWAACQRRHSRCPSLHSRLLAGCHTPTSAESRGCAVDFFVCSFVFGNFLALSRDFSCAVFKSILISLADTRVISTHFADSMYKRTWVVLTGSTYIFINFQQSSAMTRWSSG